MTPASVDVQDMTCAQALAVVAKSAAQLTGTGALEIRYNADDVKRDVLAWARSGGHLIQEVSPGLLTLHRGPSS